MDNTTLQLRAASGRMAMPASRRWIRLLIPHGVIGAYMLFLGEEPIYIGRSDVCLRKRLVGHELLVASSHVLWERCSTARQAYHLESFWYDRLKGQPHIHNRVHPASPAKSEADCPYCAVVAAQDQLAPYWPFAAVDKPSEGGPLHNVGGK